MKTKILDCTVRDGGYLNNWKFSKVLVKDLYRALSKSGVDYVEIGFRNSPRYFDVHKNGLWLFTPENEVDSIKTSWGAAISLMVDYGRADLKDIRRASESSVSLYRIAVHKDKIIEAIKFADAVIDKGYKVALQLMGIVSYRSIDFNKIIGPLRASRISFVYFADSYGSLTPFDIKKYITILRETKKEIGFHPHNNIQLAFANALEAIRSGVDIIDGTVFGMGRGAGNLPIETLIAYFEKSADENKYNVLPVLELIDKYFLKLSSKLKWGYNLPYMISGIYESHPSYATYLMDSEKYNLQNIQFALQLINKINPIGFNKDLIVKMEKKGFISDNKKLGKICYRKDKLNITRKNEGLRVAYKDRHEGRDFLVLANGVSLVNYKKEINKFIKKYSPIVIGSNYLGGLFVPHYHSFNNKDRFKQFIKYVNPGSKLLLSSDFGNQFVRSYTNRDFEKIICKNSDSPCFSIEHGVIKNDCKSISVLSIALAIVMGAKRIFVAGMDGYKDMDTFLNAANNLKSRLKKDYSNIVDVSSRGGEYHKQMEWHDLIEKLLRMVNQYLLSVNKNELLIITPTTHKLFYKDIRSFLNVDKNE